MLYSLGVHVQLRILTDLVQIMSSGSTEGLEKAQAVLASLCGSPANLYHIKGGIGAASSIKLINQLLAGIHIAAAAEAMAFGAKLGLETQSLYDIIKNAAGGSWMFENRVPAMLNADWTPHSQLAIFVKDLVCFPKQFGREMLNTCQGIVLDEARRVSYPAMLSATAHQLYLMAASHGLSGDADAGVVRVWELLTGVSVTTGSKLSHTPVEPKQYPCLPEQQTIDALPRQYEGEVLDRIRQHITTDVTPLLVVLDDDPTGTQTCHDIAVLTVWDHDMLCSELQSTETGFFILTNSRALPPNEAKELIATICKNLARAANETGKEFRVVLRGDSTLRGHFPDEPQAVENILGPFDAWIMAPFFFQGGRYTINDIHYVAENGTLIPASQTAFAADATFGYKSSNLRDYILEKAGARFSEESIFSISLEDIRIGGPDKVVERLLHIPRNSVVIVNAVAESDMLVFAAGLIAGRYSGTMKD